MQQYIVVMFAVPLITAFVCWFIQKQKWLQRTAFVGSLATSAAIWWVIAQTSARQSFTDGMFYVDALSSVLLFIISLLGFTAICFSLPYMQKEVEDGHLAPKMLPRYYSLFFIFIVTMLCVTTLDNLGMMWVAVEATTLASAFLVAFHFNRSALEAAWKYVMVCTVGICLALLGLILLYYAELHAALPSPAPLSWQKLVTYAASLDPMMVKLAFVFIFIGYGTKAGLAPMHTWLPDAHSQAPSPVSGLLSGALLACAWYAMLRVLIIVQGVPGLDFTQPLLLSFGVFSIATALPFILVQTDVKRLLAYSSVEHMGIITLGVGIGTQAAIYGALLHMVNHALTKSFLFYVAGHVIQVYKTKSIMRIRGLVTTLPFIGTLFMAGCLAITGMPPFGIFFSKLTVVWAAFAEGYSVLAWGTLLLLGGIFAGMLYYFLRMCFGRPGRRGQAAPPARSANLALGVAAVFVVLGSVYLPLDMANVLRAAASIVGRGL